MTILRTLTNVSAVSIALALVAWGFFGLSPTDSGGSPVPGVEVDVDAFALERDLKAGKTVTLDFARGPRTLDLELVDIYAPGAVLGVETDEGRETHPLESGSYRGTFSSPSNESGIASLTIHAPFLSASLRGIRHEWIETVVQDGAWVYLAGELEAIPTQADGESPALASAPPSSSRTGGTVRSFTHGTFECGTNPRDIEQIVPHSDRSLYVVLGSDLGAVQTRMEGDINHLNNFQYDNELCIQLQILGLEIHTMVNDPLSSTNPFTLINQFATHFSTQHDPNYFFDTSHLFTGKNLDGGVIGVADALGGRYSLSQQIAEGGVYEAHAGHRRILEGHEIGHSYTGDHALAATHNVWTSVVYQTVMWTPFGQYSLWDEFSDANIANIRGHSPKANV